MRFTTILSTTLVGTALVSAAPTQPRAVGDPVAVDMIGMVNKYKTHIDSALSKKDGIKSNKVCKHTTVTARKEW